MIKNTDTIVRDETIQFILSLCNLSCHANYLNFGFLQNTEANLINCLFVVLQFIMMYDCTVLLGWGFVPFYTVMIFFFLKF